MQKFPWQAFAQNSAYADQVALRNSQGDPFTWAELAEKINQVEAFLLQQGVTAQSAVAFCGKNSEQILFLYLAVIQLGAKILGINPAFPQEKREELCHVYGVDFCYQTEDIHYLATKALPEHNADFTKAATMTLTSGSTGLPKAVVHNVSAHLSNAEGVCTLMNFGKDQLWLLSLPLYHVSGQGIVWRWLYAGATLVLPKEDFYLSIGEVSHVSLVPTQLQRWFDYLVEHPQPIQTQAVLLGGTQIPVKLTQALSELGIRSYSGYGMTEMASTAFAKQSDGKIGVGQPLLGREFKLVNEEVWLKGAGLAMGYWRNGYVDPLTNAEGWFQTKDKGQWLDNELVIQGRLDNMFISGGENIQPEEIEKVIAQSDLVKQVFVLPKYDEEFGHRPVAIIEFHTSFNESAVESLNVFLQGLLERFKQPVAYYELPQDLIQGAIKISRKALADWLSQQ
ncbi:o-succinylbenzoate--CoA ligase [Haemophilus parainfluenzae]|uniref:O-succinylbenzoate--CoA ligase n=1 Tax=Haemophilus parainfluenzae TaxID=729 RepID=A0A7M1NW57_HAEPA|nr:o-succinylbenzoate--CoA ligase [Haemophilus parainfluenzae]QOR17173.1 o-succinylbenzoate--CoA ligase [Haemophilus parainfluenzae]